MEIGSHAEQRNAYFWYYLAVNAKFPALRKAWRSCHPPQRKEIREQIKQADEWMKMKLPDRMSQLKNINQPLLKQTSCDYVSHAVVIRAAATLRRNPGDDFVGVHDVAGFAMHTVGRIQMDHFALRR